MVFPGNSGMGGAFKWGSELCLILEYSDTLFTQIK